MQALLRLFDILTNWSLTFLLWDLNLFSTELIFFSIDCTFSGKMHEVSYQNMWEFLRWAWMILGFVILVRLWVFLLLSFSISMMFCSINVYFDISVPFFFLILNDFGFFIKFVVRKNGSNHGNLEQRIAGIDWNFNGWGGKILKHSSLMLNINISWVFRLIDDATWSLNVGALQCNNLMPCFAIYECVILLFRLLSMIAILKSWLQNSYRFSFLSDYWYFWSPLLRKWWLISW